MAGVLLVKTLRRLPACGPVLAAALLLGACAATPVLDPAGTDPALTPQGAAARADPPIGRRVLWGGGIVASVNRAQVTEVEVIAYPLAASQRPDDRAAPLGRFVLVWPGYLETVDYAPGRRVTARGTLREVRPGKVGQAGYRYPVIEAEAVHLWPPGDTGGWSSLPIQLGIGIWIGN